MKIKTKLKQFFCKHEECRWYVKETKFHNLRGQTEYKVCERCEKVINTRFREYEGMGWK